MKKIIFTFFTATLLLTSCSSDDSSSDDEMDPPSDVVLLKSLIVTYEDGSTYTSNYTYSGNKLMGYTDSDGLNEVYIYTGDLLTQIDEYEDGDLDIETILEYDSNDRLIKETYMYADGTSEMNEFTYNADGSITENEGATNSYVYTYANGNRITETSSDNNYDYTYTYDNKNNPFKNVHQREVLDLIGEYASLNNILSYINNGGGSSVDDFTNTYIYNSNDYPISGTSTYFEFGSSDEMVETMQFVYE